MTNTENGDSTGKGILCLLVLQNKIRDAGVTKLSYTFWMEATNL
jgi:hypothetical protein